MNPSSSLFNPINMKLFCSTILATACLLFTACSTCPKDKRPSGLFLGDLSPIKARVGFGDYTVNAYPEPQNAKILVDGKPCAYFIFAHTNSDVTYKIPDGMKSFTATGIRPSGNPWIAGTFSFEVIVDGKSVFKSQSLNSYPNYQVPISITLPPDAQILELKTDNLGNGFADHSIWAYPFFHKATDRGY